MYNGGVRQRGKHLADWQAALGSPDTDLLQFGSFKGLTRKHRPSRGHSWRAIQDTHHTRGKPTSRLMLNGGLDSKSSYNTIRGVLLVETGRYFLLQSVDSNPLAGIDLTA